jgi:hypothetical protein
VVDVGIVGHSGESCLGVLGSEFVGNVFFPKLGKVEWRHDEIIHFPAEEKDAPPTLQSEFDNSRASR